MTIAQIVFAIYIIEGGSNAVPPYGIMDLKAEWVAASPSRKDTVEVKCKRWCENTVKLNLQRWEAAGKPGCYLDFLGDRYCPASVDPVGNKNWKRNIKRRLKHETCDCHAIVRDFSVHSKETGHPGKG